MFPQRTLEPSAEKRKYSVNYSGVKSSPTVLKRDGAMGWIPKENRRCEKFTPLIRRGVFRKQKMNFLPYFYFKPRATQRGWLLPRQQSKQLIAEFRATFLFIIGSINNLTRKTLGHVDSRHKHSVDQPLLPFTSCKAWAEFYLAFLHLSGKCLEDSSSPPWLKERFWAGEFWSF